MTELWYWRSNERIRGPLVTEELESLVVNNRLADADAVRLEGGEEWISATEIRQMFAGGGDSPAETAAKLLQSAAARRLEGGSPANRQVGFLSRIAVAAGDLAGDVWDLLVRALDVSTRWLGIRGRLLITFLAGAAVVVFLASRWMTWGSSDLSRLQQLQAVRDRARDLDPASGSVDGRVDQEVRIWLATTQAELEAKLRDRPVSGSAGSDRQSALARREMLFAVREMRRSTVLDDAARGRIDESLEKASDYLTGAAAVEPSLAGPPARNSGGTQVVTVFLVIDALVAVLIVLWWITRRRGR